MDTLKRILSQAEKALADEPVECLEDAPLGLYDLTHREVRIGNIIAMARVAIDRHHGGDPW